MGISHPPGNCKLVKQSTPAKNESFVTDTIVGFIFINLGLRFILVISSKSSLGTKGSPTSLLAQRPDIVPQCVLRGLVVGVVALCRTRFVVNPVCPEVGTTDESITRH